MIAKNMVGMVQNSSAIRAMFEEGQRLASIYGAENVYDFSLGNPNVAPPEKVKDSILEIISQDSPMAIHGYMSNSGYEEVRSTIAAHLNDLFGTNFTGNNLIMACFT